MEKRYLYDKNQTHYQLVKSIPGNTLPNWLFIPGGPGIDAQYFVSFISHLQMSGNYWLVDFPNNGSNICQPQADDTIFESWRDCLLHSTQLFEKPIIIGHSFGGMLPLFIPALEALLSGLILIGAAPTLWMQASEEKIKTANLAIAQKARDVFITTPNEQTFKKTIIENAHLYFADETLEEGKRLFQDTPFNYEAVLWWVNKVSAPHGYEITWVPKKTPTLLLSGEQDFIVPFSLFKADTRFQKHNIGIKEIQNAGHFPWMEQMSICCQAIEEWYQIVISK